MQSKAFGFGSHAGSLAYNSTAFTSLSHLPGLVALLSQQIRRSSSWLAFLSGWPQTPEESLKKWVILAFKVMTLWPTVSLVLSSFFLFCRFWICFEHFSYESLLWADAGLYMCLLCSQLQIYLNALDINCELCCCWKASNCWIQKYSYLNLSYIVVLRHVENGSWVL